MPSFESGQKAMMAALDRGPAYLPPDLFAGSPERVLAGMAVHANTISHARLMALEETFPRTLARIGHAAFNGLARAFVEQPEVGAQPLAGIGAGFDAFLADHGDAGDAADLARFEWLWLQAYHAAEAEPMDLGALAGLSPEALLDMVLAAHPAAIAHRFAPLVNFLLEAEVPGLGATEAILLTRPEADVLVAPASALMAEILSLAQTPQTIGNLLASGNETLSDEAPAIESATQALVALINAGAFVRA